MKSLILSIILIVSAVSTTYAQDLLSHYIAVKNALVKGDATTAAIEAGKISGPLSADAVVIANTKDIEVQRKKFKTLSDNLYTLSKSVKLSEAPVYRMYCPMKKSYWLSTETAIKNPYYGKQMLTCGNVTDTL